jgi:hypothetical protein
MKDSICIAKKRKSSICFEKMGLSASGIAVALTINVSNLILASTAAINCS